MTFSRPAIRRAARFSMLASLGLFAASPALAQSAGGSSPGFFMPPTHQDSAPAPAARSHAPARHDTEAAQPAPAAEQASMPAIPKLPALPQGSPPPVAVIGVLSVPEVMQKSTAAQGVQKVIQERQAELGKDAQKARAKIQSEQSAIVADRSKLSDAELERKELALREQITSTQTKFEARNAAIQASGQQALSQIESELIAIIRQEAQARGMNLVLHREQVALNVQAFDITNDVVAELNKLMPSVTVPPSVVTPEIEREAASQADQAGQGTGQ